MPDGSPPGPIGRFRQEVLLHWLLSTWGPNAPPARPGVRPWLRVGRLVRNALPLSMRRLIRHRMFRRVDFSFEAPGPSSNPVRLRVRGQAEVSLHYEIFAQGSYDAAIQYALQGRSPGSPFRVLDLGANVGFFALRLLALCPSELTRQRLLSLTLVEANPELLPQIRERLQVDNDTGEVDLRIVPGLVGRRSGRGVLHVSPLHSHSTISGERGIREVAMDYVDLEAFVPREEPIDLLKCDIEGAEESFLETYPDLLRRSRVLVLELHPPLCDTERCRGLLRDSGFSEPKIVFTSDDSQLLWTSRTSGSSSR